MPDSRRKRAVAAIYSRTAKRLYEPLVVQGGFKLFGGQLNKLVLEQGRRAVASADGAPILDMPIGTAFFTLEIAPQHPGPIVGVDIAAGMVRQARVAAEAAGAENIITLQGDAHRLPFSDASFGAILCTNGLQVIPGLRPTLEELVRVVRPGGIVYTSLLTVPLSRLASASAKARMPTILRSGQDVAGEFSKVGFQVLGIKHERLATLIEARRPAS